MKRLLILIGMQISFSYAQEIIAICEPSQNVHQLFQCLVENHPKATANKTELQAGKYGIEQGKQRPNPSINAQTIAGEQYGQNVSETTVQYLHTFELGGKRSARIEKAEAEVASVQAEIFGTNVEISNEIILKLYRIKQNAKEIAIISETIDTFNKILKTYSSRPVLSPEQKVSNNVFSLAAKDYENRKNNLLLEQAELQTYFNSLSLVSYPKILGLVEGIQFKIEYLEKKFSDILNSKKENSPELQLADAQLKIALADLSLQKSETWGNLQIGPIYQYRYEEGNGFPVVGIGLTLPLPLYNQNQGGKQKTLFQYKSMEYLKNYELKKIQSEWPILEKAFAQTTNNVKNQPSNVEIEKKHHELEGLFYRGLVPSSLIVEAHRQMVDLTIGQHEQQLKCLQLLFRAYALNGEIPKDYL